ncbi:MAG TPA: prepilin-type N-terminal cleavage/methylation domain-containing protein [Kiritimatiellia bacterium]|nr:prepilin-type N-terminal cleavage/methylation domain-containing protein [Kiritimatiellia bacterium]
MRDAGWEEFRASCISHLASRIPHRASRIAQPASRIPPRPSRGFTLVELLVALTVVAVAFTIVWQSFASVLKAWRRGAQVVDEVRHGDFVIDQLVSALRSTAYFPLRPERYGFWLENRGDNDEVSWVTSGTAFIPPDSPLAQGLHRIMVSVEPGPNGGDAFTVRAFPHLAEEIEKRDVDGWPISSRVQGLNVRVWNVEEERWEDEWEDTNKIPGLVEVTLFMTPPERYEPPMKISRLIQIPLGPAVTSTTPVATGQPGAPAAAQGGNRAERRERPRTDAGNPGGSTDRPRTSIISGQ